MPSFFLKEDGFMFGLLRRLSSVPLDNDRYGPDDLIQDTVLFLLFKYLNKEENAMTDILPVSTGVGFGNSDGWGDAAGAFAGALFGSWFGGNGFGGYGWGRGYPGAAAEATGFSTQILNDGINAIQNSINGMNMSLSNGLCNVGYQNLDQSNKTNVAMLQGFATLGHDNCQNTNSIVGAVNSLGSKVQDCCCATQRLIEQQGCQTRELIQALNTQDIRDKLCDAKAKNAALESNLYTNNALNSAVSTIITHIKAMQPTTASSGSTAA